jgi:hypothetical protein
LAEEQDWLDGEVSPTPLKDASARNPTPA